MYQHGLVLSCMIFRGQNDDKSKQRINQSKSIKQTVNQSINLSVCRARVYYQSGRDYQSYCYFWLSPHLDGHWDHIPRNLDGIFEWNFNLVYPVIIPRCLILDTLGNWRNLLITFPWWHWLSVLFLYNKNSQTFILYSTINMTWYENINVDWNHHIYNTDIKWNLHSRLHKYNGFFLPMECNNSDCMVRAWWYT